MLAKHHAKCRFVRYPYEKGSDLVRKWRVYKAPTILICDASSDTPEKRPFAKIQGKKSPASIRMEILKALAKLERLKR